MESTLATVGRFVSLASKACACSSELATTAAKSTDFEAELISFSSKTTAGKPFDCLEVIDQRADRFLAAGDRAVDTLVRKKQRALDAATAAEGGQRRAQGLKAVEPGKLVERGDADWLNFLGCCHAHATRPW